MDGCLGCSRVCCVLVYLACWSVLRVGQLLLPGEALSAIAGWRCLAQGKARQRWRERFVPLAMVAVGIAIRAMDYSLSTNAVIPALVPTASCHAMHMHTPQAPPLQLLSRSVTSASPGCCTHPIVAAPEHPAACLDTPEAHHACSTFACCAP